MNLNRITFLVFVLVLICAHSPALHAGGVEVTFDVRAGLTLARATYDPPSAVDNEGVENKFRIGLGGGGVVSLSFIGFEPLSLESGLLLQMKGGETRMPITWSGWGENDGQNMTWEINWKLLYFTIPLRARIAFRNSGFIPYVKTGLDLDILLSAKYSDIIIGSSELPGGERNIDNSAALDVALVGGAGMEFPTGRVRLYVEATYCHGLRNVLEPEDPSVDVKLHNRVIGITAGVRF